MIDSAASDRGRTTFAMRRASLQQIRLPLALAGSALLTACATTVPLQAFQYVPDTSHGVFAPVRVTINRDRAMPDFYRSRHDLILAELEASGAFAEVGPDVDSPMLLDIRLARHTADSASTVARRVLSAVTLFLVPGTARNINQVEVDCYLDGQLVRRYEYAGAYEERLSIYRYSELKDGGQEFVSLRNIVHHLLRDLDRDAIFPRQPASPEIAAVPRRITT